METLIFIELPDGFWDMEVENVLNKACVQFLSNKITAQKEAERLGLGWPAWMARNERAHLTTVTLLGTDETTVKDLVDCAEQIIRQQVDLRKNPPKLSGCGFGILGMG